MRECLLSRSYYHRNSQDEWEANTFSFLRTTLLSFLMPDICWTMTRAYKGTGRVNLKPAVHGNRKRGSLCPTYAILYVSLAKIVLEERCSKGILYISDSPFFFSSTQPSFKFFALMPNLASQITVPLPQSSLSPST